MTKNFKILIVEDEARGRNALKAMLNPIAGISLIGEAENVDQAITIIEKESPDLLLLDVEMPYKNGFDLLAAIPNRTFDVIFTTAYDSYAIKAIKFSAIDYLLKPIDPDELRTSIEKTIEKRKALIYSPQEQINNLLTNLKTTNKQNFKLSLPTSEGSVFIPIEDITRCESDANYTWFHISSEPKPILVSKTLKDYENLLLDYGFCRVHHSHLINLKYITKYIKGEGGVVVMMDGAEVEVSRRKREVFQKSLEKYAQII